MKILIVVLFLLLMGHRPPFLLNPSPRLKSIPSKRRSIGCGTVAQMLISKSRKRGVRRLRLRSTRWIRTQAGGCGSRGQM